MPAPEHLERWTPQWQLAGLTGFRRISEEGDTRIADRYGIEILSPWRYVAICPRDEASLVIALDRSGPASKVHSPYHACQVRSKPPS